MTAAVVTAGSRTQARRLPGVAEGSIGPLSMAEVLALTARVLDRALPHRRHERRDSQLPDALDRLASAIRAGQSVGPAFAGLVASLPIPLRTDLEPVAASLAHGEPAAVALARWAGLPGASADVRLTAAALTVGAEAGGEVARAVDRLSATLRERHALRGEVRALATQARTSAAVLAMAPVAFTGLVATIEPAAVAFLVTSPVGLACLVSGVGLECIGAAWMTRITRGAA